MKPKAPKRDKPVLLESQKERLREIYCSAHILGTSREIVEWQQEWVVPNSQDYYFNILSGQLELNSSAHPQK